MTLEPLRKSLVLSCAIRLFFASAITLRKSAAAKTEHRSLTEAENAVNGLFSSGKQTPIEVLRRRIGVELES